MAGSGGPVRERHEMLRGASWPALVPARVAMLGAAAVLALSVVLVPGASAHGHGTPRGLDLTLLITADVHGAVFPTQRKDSLHCSMKTYTTTPCNCVGGAARRLTVLQAAATNDAAAADVVVLDAGGYFFGGGFAFPAFNGNASAYFFAQSGYDAFGLEYRDFIAFEEKTLTGFTGVAGMLDHFDAARALDPTLPSPVITNLVFDGAASPFAADAIVPHTIIPLANNMTAGIISM